MFTFLFVLAVVPAIIIGFRIFQRKDIFMFDLLIVFSTLYLWAIPCKDFLLEHEFPEYVGDTLVAGTLCWYMWLLMGAEVFYARYKKGNNFTNVSRFFRLWRPAATRPVFMWVILLVGLFYLYNITNYGALSADNAEENNRFGYGENMPFFMRVFAISILPVYPLLIVLAYHFKSRDMLSKCLRVACLAVLAAGALLGSKTRLTFLLIFFLIYLYSTRRDLLTKRNMLLGAGLLVVLFLVVFPISQGLRVYKQYYVENRSVHDFATVVKAYANQRVNIGVDDRVERYQHRRSMNAYATFDFVCNTKHRGNGDLTWTMCRYIIPQRTIMDGKGEILAQLQDSGDVAESVVSWYVCDYGTFWGPIAAVIHFVVIIWLFQLMGRFFKMLFHNDTITLMAMSLALYMCVSIEHNPSGDIRVFYATYSIVFVACGILFKIFSMERERRRRMTNYA